MRKDIKGVDPRDYFTEEQISFCFEHFNKFLQEDKKRRSKKQFSGYFTGKWDPAYTKYMFDNNKTVLMQQAEEYG